VDVLDLQKVCHGLPPAWFYYLRDWDRMLRSGNYPETTRYSYLLAGAQLSRFLLDNAERLGAEEAAEDPTEVERGHIEEFQAWMVRTRSASTALNKLPSISGDWRPEMNRRARSARQVLRRHPWSIALLQSRTHPGPATLRHHNAVIGTLRGAGFSVAMTAHAYALLDSYVYGFALSEASLPINGPETVAEVAESMMVQYLAKDYPHLSEFSTEHILKPGNDFGQEFEYGLELVLDGLTRSLAGTR
jgi:hypothetical protein